MWLIVNNTALSGFCCLQSDVSHTWGELSDVLNYKWDSKFSVDLRINWCFLCVCSVTGGELFEDIVAREYYSEADARYSQLNLLLPMTWVRTC